MQRVRKNVKGNDLGGLDEESAQIDKDDPLLPRFLKRYDLKGLERRG